MAHATGLQPRLHALAGQRPCSPTALTSQCLECVCCVQHANSWAPGALTSSEYTSKWYGIKIMYDRDGGLTYQTDTAYAHATASQVDDLNSLVMGSQRKFPPSTDWSLG